MGLIDYEFFNDSVSRNNVLLDLMRPISVEWNRLFQTTMEPALCPSFGHRADFLMFAAMD